MVSICLKARCKYKKQALFLSCFGVYTDFSYFLPGLFQTFCCVLGAVFEISAFSATFSLVFAGYCAVFCEVLGFYVVSATFCLVFAGLFAGFWVLFFGFLQFQLLFLGFSQAFGLGLGAVLEVLEITAPQVLPTVCAINLWLLNIMLI